jgi:hypothetical protein
LNRETSSGSHFRISIGSPGPARFVVAARDLQAAHGALWLVTITSAEHRAAGPGDGVTSDLGGAGLAGSNNCPVSEDRHYRRAVQGGSELCRRPGGISICLPQQLAGLG